MHYAHCYNSCYTFPFTCTKRSFEFSNISQWSTQDKIGKMTIPQYVGTHEQLEKLHLIIDCATLNEQMDNQNDRNFSKILPPVKTILSRCGNKQLIELRKCQATIHFNAECHVSQRELHFSPYALYLSNPNNTLHMYTKSFSN